VSHDRLRQPTVHRLRAGGATAALELGRDQLAATDGALATIGDVVAEVRALAIQGNSASYDAAARDELAVQVRALFGAALAAANQRAPSGEYLLAGAASLTAPFDAAGGYAGDPTTRALPDGSLVSIAGASLTAAVPGGVDVLPLLDRVATALTTSDRATLNTAVGELATAVRQVADAPARGGAAASVLDTTLAANAQLDVQLAETIARGVEIDPIAAATELAQATQSLEASRLVSSHIANLLDPRAMGL
jgi:flagellar hook-associated protein 3 FlgL